MTRTLYISDLDGTLLNHQGKLSEETVQILNQLIEYKNLNFSVATARTPATLEGLLKALKIKEPIVIMNGVALYHLGKFQYEQVEYLTEAVVQSIVKKLGDWIKQSLIYTLVQNELIVHYDSLENKGRMQFYNERKNLKYKRFVKEPIEEKDYNTVIYFVFIDTKEHIETVYNVLQDIPHLCMMNYQDPYSKDYLLEVFSDKATKANGIKKLKEKRHYDKIICFGDQINDKDMFHMADEAYAVENANSEIKKIATAVIGPQDDNSVAKFIKERM